jgi:hypothetical protein
MKNNFLFNKKGEKLISIYWFVILTLVAGGIFIMVNSFYNSPYDVRKVESEILAEKVADCIYEGGVVNPSLMQENNPVFRDFFKDNFERICNLNFDTKNEWDPEQHFVRVVFYGSEKKITKSLNISAGNLNYEEDCYTKTEHPELAQCALRSFFAYLPDGKMYFVEITAATAKTKENV